MLIDGHAHAGGVYRDADSILAYMAEHGIDKLVLCPADGDGTRTYNVPMLSDYLRAPEIAFGVNHVIAAATRLSGAAKTLDAGNERIGLLSRALHGRVYQAYWADPADPHCIEKLEDVFALYDIRMVKLHQCWHKCDLSAYPVTVLLQWCAQRRLPVFVHLKNYDQLCHFTHLTNRFRDLPFIVAHLIGYDFISENSDNRNVYFDISAPQLIQYATFARAARALGGSRRLVFGSDIPYGTDNLRLNFDRVDRVAIPAQEKEDIRGNNLAQLLRL